MEQVTLLKDAGDILHRGDVLAIRYSHYARGWATQAIIDYQTRQGAVYPLNEISHVLVCSGGRDWLGYSMDPPRGAEINVRETYHDCQLWVLRYEKWRDDEQRYRFVDRAAYLANARYSFDGLARLATHIFPKFGGRFCSEQVELAAEQCGVEHGDGFIFDAAADSTPSEIAASPFLRHVATVWMP